MTLNVKTANQMHVSNVSSLSGTSQNRKGSTAADPPLQIAVLQIRKEIRLLQFRISPLK